MPQPQQSSAFDHNGARGISKIKVEHCSSGYIKVHSHYLLMLGGVYFLYTEFHWTFTTPTTLSHMLDGPLIDTRKRTLISIRSYQRRERISDHNIQHFGNLSACLRHPVFHFHNSFGSPRVHRRHVVVVVISFIFQQLLENITVL